MLGNFTMHRAQQSCSVQSWEEGWQSHSTLGYSPSPPNPSRALSLPHRLGRRAGTSSTHPCCQQGFPAAGRMQMPPGLHCFINTSFGARSHPEGSSSFSAGKAEGSEPRDAAQHQLWLRGDPFPAELPFLPKRATLCTSQG